MKTPITYYGGKQNMLRHILPLVPPHTLYTEAFVGGAALFFAKEPAPVEVINDLNSELINFYRTIAGDFSAVKTLVDTTLHSRGLHVHAWYIYNNPTFFTNAERAWAMWVLSKSGFGGRISKSFGFDKAKGNSVKKIAFAKQNFSGSLSERLEHTTIECDDGLKVIARYDTPEAFHFVDPPYVGSDMGHYSGMFNEQDLARLLEVLSGVAGKFMLATYPNDAVAAAAKKRRWRIHAVERRVVACKVSARRMQGEWMVLNYNND